LPRSGEPDGRHRGRVCALEIHQRVVLAVDRQQVYSYLEQPVPLLLNTSRSLSASDFIDSTRITGRHLAREAAAPARASTSMPSTSILSRSRRARSSESIVIVRISTVAASE